jgi:hypothetical protein
MAVREGRFSRDCHEVLVEGTVRGAVSHVVQAFRTAEKQNPQKDDDHELIILLSQQFQAYKNDNPQLKQQKALPLTGDGVRFCVASQDDIVDLQQLIVTL